MSKKAEKVEEQEAAVVWQIAPLEIKLQGGKLFSLETFFTTKMGGTAGKRLYKELATAVAEFSSEPVAVDLDSKHGTFVTYRSS